MVDGGVRGTRQRPMDIGGALSAAVLGPLGITPSKRTIFTGTVHDGLPSPWPGRVLAAFHAPS